MVPCEGRPRPLGMTPPPIRLHPSRWLARPGIVHPAPGSPLGRDVIILDDSQVTGPTHQMIFTAALLAADPGRPAGEALITLPSGLRIPNPIVTRLTPSSALPCIMGCFSFHPCSSYWNLAGWLRSSRNHDRALTAPMIARRLRRGAHRGSARGRESARGEHADPRSTIPPPFLPHRLSRPAGPGPGAADRSTDVILLDGGRDARGLGLDRQPPSPAPPSPPAGPTRSTAACGDLAPHPPVHPMDGWADPDRPAGGARRIPGDGVAVQHLRVPHPLGPRLPWQLPAHGGRSTMPGMLNFPGPHLRRSLIPVHECGRPSYLRPSMSLAPLRVVDPSACLTCPGTLFLMQNTLRASLAPPRLFA